MKRIFYIIILLMAVLYFGCKEEGRLDHIDDNAPAPAQVTDVTVENRPGGALLTYQVPPDKNLLYVQAVYEIQPGVQREAKSSYYKDSLVLEGFGDTRTYDVLLYSVGKNEKTSEPLKVQVNPTTAPVHLATKQLREAFGGVGINIENPGKVNLAVVLMGDTAQLGYQSVLETFYTSAEKANFALRGLDTIPGNYSVYIRDRWNNLSDTIYATLTPLFEEEISKPWFSYDLPGDAPELCCALIVSCLWNNNYTDAMSCYFSDELPLPQTLTWDFGKTIIPSRFKMWPRNTPDDVWKRGHARVFEIYGSLAPNLNGSLDDSWIPLGKFESTKPTPGETITQEDMDFARAGIDYDFVSDDFAPNPFVPIRYIRIRTLSTYYFASVSTVSFQEFNFWGMIQK